MPKPLEYNATLSERTDVTDSLSIFRFRPDDDLPPAPWFVGGQYVVIGLNNDAKPELGKVQRPMSIASSPHDREAIEFYIRFVGAPASDNPLTHLLWTLKPGERAFVRPVPKGRFTIEHLVGAEDRRLKLCVGAGTGLAPFVSMVLARMQAGETDLSEWGIIHGASYAEDLGYRPVLESIAAERRLAYLPTVSRERPNDGWTDSRGRAEDFFREERLSDLEERLRLRKGELNPDRVAIFVCGLQGTIGCSIERLLGRGFVPDHRGIRKALEVPETVPASLFFEQYDHEPAIDIKDEALVADLKQRLRSSGRV